MPWATLLGLRNTIEGSTAQKNIGSVSNARKVMQFSQITKHIWKPVELEVIVVIAAKCFLGDFLTICMPPAKLMTNLWHLIILFLSPLPFVVFSYLMPVQKIWLYSLMYNILHACITYCHTRDDVQGRELYWAPGQLQHHQTENQQIWCWMWKAAYTSAAY